MYNRSMEKFENKKIPFKESLVPEEKMVAYDKLYKFENNDDYVIRMTQIRTLENEYGNSFDGKEMTGEEMAVVAKKLFSELEEKYNIKVPINLIIAEDESAYKTVYSIAEKIKGNDLIFHSENILLKEKIQELYRILSEYYLDKIVNNGFFLTDLNQKSQYIFKDNKMNMIDGDLYFDNRKEILLSVVYWFIRHLNSIKNNWEIDITEIQENLKDIVSEFEKNFEKLDGDNLKMINSIKDFIGNKSNLFKYSVDPKAITF